MHHLLPVRGREAGERRQVLGCVAQHRLHLHRLAPGHPCDHPELFAHVRGIGLGEDRTDWTPSPEQETPNRPPLLRQSRCSCSPRPPQEFRLSSLVAVAWGINRRNVFDRAVGHCTHECSAQGRLWRHHQELEDNQHQSAPAGGIQQYLERHMWRQNLLVVNGSDRSPGIRPAASGRCGPT
jgi:hypothetical protein